MKDEVSPQDVTQTLCFSLAEDSSSEPKADAPTSQTSSAWEAFLFDRRYKFLSVIASKLGSSVALHWDQYLCRNVVIKTQYVDQDEQDRERFLSECRISAAFEHPGIIPIYDIQNSPGKVRLAMRKVEGKTLSDWLAGEYPGKGLSKKKANRVIQIFLEVCNVLEFVHSKGHIHRDIKPANIMVDEFGKVFLIDWGSAPSGEAAQWATPTYMSPEQANGEEVDCRSDIFSLGVTLFECLFGRPPLPKSQREELFERRRNGEIDLPTPGERSRVPEPLIAICLKAIAKNPQRRYATARQLANDLANFQAGLAVSAQPDSISDFAMRWFARNRSTLIKSTLVAIPFVILCAVLYQLLLRDVAKWGSAIFKENFDGSDWSNRWGMMARPDWISKNGGIAYPLRALGWESIFLQKMFSGPIAVEFDCFVAQATPGEPPPSDVTLIWAENGAVDGFQDNFTLMQFGAYSNELAIVAQNSKSLNSSSSGTSVVNFSPYRLQRGKTHHFRVEIEGNLVTMWADRKRILRTELLVPLQNGWIGFWAGGGLGNKIFDNVTVYSRGVAERVPATTLGDYHLTLGNLEEAAGEFARISASHPHSPIGQEATFKHGLALWRSGDQDRAITTWGQLTDDRFALDAKILQLARLFEERDFKRFIPEFQATAAQFPLEKNQKLQLFWASCARDVPGSLMSLSDASALLNLTENHKDCSLAVNLGRHSILSGLEDFKTIRTELGGRSGISLVYLHKMGLHNEIFQRPAQTLSCFSAKKNSKLFTADYEGARSIANLGAQWQAEICLNQNGLEETERLFPNEKLTRRYLLLENKKYEELLKEQPDDPQSVFYALQGLGRAQEILDNPTMSQELKPLARYFLLFEKYRSGDHATALQEYLATQADLASKVLPHSEMWFEHTLMPAFLLAHSGQPDEAMQRLRAFSSNPHNQFRNAQIPWFFLRYLTGEISAEEFTKQPTTARLEARKTLADALRAELAGDKPTALAAYQTYAAMPNHKKDNTIFIQHFIDWRLAELSSSAKLTQVKQP